VQIETDMVARGIAQVDVPMVKTYAKDLWSLLEEADFTETKAFLRSFIERIEVNKRQAASYYNLPIPQGMPLREQVEVLPIETSGGRKRTIDRTLV
jgi:site-specific DNA recombinase